MSVPSFIRSLVILSIFFGEGIFCCFLYTVLRRKILSNVCLIYNGASPIDDMVEIMNKKKYRRRYKRVVGFEPSSVSFDFDSSNYTRVPCRYFYFCDIIYIYINDNIGEQKSRVLYYLATSGLRFEFFFWNKYF